MMNIKLIAFDIDGTILDDQKRLVSENREAFQEAQRKGLLLCIASGRMLSTIELVEKQLGVDCVIIAYNGGMIAGRRSEGRPLLGHQPVPAEATDFLIGFAREHNYLLNFYHQDLLYAEDAQAANPLLALYSRRTGARYQLVADLKTAFPGITPTKLILLADALECDRLLPDLRCRLEGRACIVKSEPEYLEITAPGIDKGSALPVIARRYGISTGEIMAVGDAENDIGMLRAAGLGVAVANASPEVKACANRVTERTNNDGGAAEAIYRWAMSSAG
jgi:Cof subfamily protein (haloacid dehalogenase superfamily)